MYKLTTSRFFIYALCEPEGDQEIRYVGLSSTGMSRPNSHWTPTRLAEDRTYKACWIRSVLKRGLKPLIEVVEELTSKDGLAEAERFWICQFKALGFRLTNLTEGGEGPIGYKHSAETRRRMSESGKGRVFTQEHKDKIGAANKGKKRDPEEVERRMQKVRGRKMTDEQKARMSLAQKGRLGHPHSEETKRHLSEIRKGTKLTPEQCILWSRVRGGRPFVDQNGTVYDSQWDCARKLGIDQGSIGKVLSGKYKQTRGYTFKYIEGIQ